MVNHRRSPGEADDTAVYDAEYQQDVADLLASSTRLREIGEQVDEAQRAAITLAVEHAVKESVRITDSRTSLIRRRGYRLTVLVAIVLAVATALPFSVVGYVEAQQATTQTAQFAAGDAASSEVTNARASSLLIGRRDFTNANAALVAAGLTPVPDPGPAANAQQMEGAAGEALGTLRAIGELQKRGLQVPGVVAPDPAGGRFPDLRH